MNGCRPHLPSVFIHVRVNAEPNCTAPSLNSPNTMPTLIIHVDKITPNAGYKQKGTQTEPYVQLKLRKPHSE
jgi:hypothetical protein